MNIKQTAKKLQKMGGDEDTILAHINPMEAAMLKEGGGSGKRNPKTGLLSFAYGDNDRPGGGDVAEGSYGNDGGFGGADYYGGLGNIVAAPVGPNGNMSLADQYASYGLGRQAAEVANGYGYGATQSDAGKLAAQWGSIPAPIRSLIPGSMFADIGSFLTRNSALGTNTNGAGGIVQGGSDKYADPGNGYESGYGGDYAMSGRDNPGAYAGGMLGTAPLAQPAALPQYTRPPFVSKFGGPRSWATSAYSPARRGLLGS